MTVYASRTHAAHRAPRHPWRTALIVAVALLGVTAVAALGPALWTLHRDPALGAVVVLLVGAWVFGLVRRRRSAA